MAQTALDWFFDNLKNHEVQSEHFELYQQAIAMERQQIVDAFYEGMQANTFDPNKGRALIYYNETYNK